MQRQCKKEEEEKKQEAQNRNTKVGRLDRAITNFTSTRLQATLRLEKLAVFSIHLTYITSLTIRIV